MIRLANEDDATAVATIYAPYVEHSHFTFEEVPPSPEEMAARMGNPLHPWLAVELDGAIVGYASTSPMRSRAAYRWSVETGIYLAAEAQGRGLGRKLLAAHLELLEQRGGVKEVEDLPRV